METINSVWEEVQAYEAKRIWAESEQLYNYLSGKIDCIKGPLKYELCITNRCNQHCLHCSNGSAPKNELFDLKCIDEVLKQEPLWVVLTGGEPLLHPDVFSFISTIKNQGALIRLCTNGVFLTEDVCAHLSELLTRYDVIQISLDASNPQTYKKIRGSDDFEIVLKNIEIARDKMPDVTVDVHCVPNCYNFREIPQIYNIAQRLKADVFSTAPLAYLGRAKQEYQVDVLDLLQTEKELYYLSLDKPTRYIGRLFEICSLFGLVQNARGLGKREQHKLRCDAGLASIYIDCDKKVYPCVYLKTPIFCLGSLEKELPPILARARTYYLEGHSIKGMRCETCNLLGLCQGGCIGVAYAFSGVAKPGFDPRCGQFNKDRNICLEKEGEYEQI